MKKALTVLIMALMAAVLTVSCDDNKATEREEKTCTVTFNTGDQGSEVPSLTVKYGETAKEPENEPEREGFSFSGWFTSEKGRTEFDFSRRITEDTVIYAAWKKVYKIGDTGPAGGIIFYDAGRRFDSTYKDKDGNVVTFTWRYLEAAPTDSIEKLQCGPLTDSNSGKAVGTGKSNTVELMKGGLNKHYHYKYQALNACLDYVSNGYSDWFMPSIGELKLMYENLKTKGIGIWKTGEDDSYWSSTIGYRSDGCADATVLYLDFRDGSEGSRNRSSFDDHLWVRPIRAFL